MKYTQDQIRQKLESLPKDIKDAISSVDTTTKLVEIADKYKLHTDKMGMLVDETGLVMLGFTRPDDFVGNLKDRLEISRSMAESIVREINEQVFLKIRYSLKKIHEEREEKEDENETDINKNINNFIKNEQDFINKTKQPIQVEFEENNQKATNERNERNEVLEQNIRRDQVLREIENPLGEVKKENEDETKKLLNEPEKDIVKEEESLVKKEDFFPKPANIIESKLSGVIKTSSLEKDISQEVVSSKKEEKSEVKKTLNTDPYREPIE